MCHTPSIDYVRDELALLSLGVLGGELVLHQNHVLLAVLVDHALQHGRAQGVETSGHVAGHGDVFEETQPRESLEDVVVAREVQEGSNIGLQISAVGLVDHLGQDLLVRLAGEVSGVEVQVVDVSELLDRGAPAYGSHLTPSLQRDNTRARTSVSVSTTDHTASIGQVVDLEVLVGVAVGVRFEFTETCVRGTLGDGTNAVCIDVPSKEETW